MKLKPGLKFGGEEELPPMYIELKTIYKQEFGINLTDEEAEEMGGRLLKLGRAIITHKQNKEVKMEGN